MSAFVVRPEDRLLTIREYCERFKRSRASFYRDKAAGIVQVVMLGGSPRIVERQVIESLALTAHNPST